MTAKNIIPAINQVIKHWSNQGIKISAKSVKEIEIVKKVRGDYFPNDFKKFYTSVNGMGDYYPNEIDNEGFLFYPIEAVISAKEDNLSSNGNLYVFAEFMHRSWWYGFEVVDADNYVIGIIACENHFKPITTSLAEFIQLYLEDAPILYDYK